MKALVFGRTGQVAQELQRRAPPHWTIECVGRETVDFLNPGSCGAFVEACVADVVINAAAYTAVDRAESQEDLATIVNAGAPGEIADAAARKGLPFIHLSTDYVFDGDGQRPWRPDDAPAPINAYGRSKLAGERAILSAGGRHLILRTSWIFSSHGANFVKAMLRLGAERDEVRVVADQTGGPTFAGAIADALFQIAQRLNQPDAPSGVYHFAGSPDVSWADFAREIFRQAGVATRVCDITSGEYLTAARRPLSSRLDCAALERDFGVVRPDWRADAALVVKELKTHGST